MHSLGGKHDIALNYCSKSISILSTLYNKIILNRQKEITEEEESDNDKQVNKIFNSFRIFKQNTRTEILIETLQEKAFNQ